MIHLTSDLHIQHSNIIGYANRPFKDPSNSGCSSQKKCANCTSKLYCTNLMNEALINNWNSVVAVRDTVYHVGDFMMGYRAAFDGIDPIIYWERMLNGKIVHIIGNHDRPSELGSTITHMIMKIGDYTALVQHTPPTMELEIPEIVDMVIHGHTHSPTRILSLGDIPLINVNVEAWGYTPVSIDTILELYKSVK